MKKFLIVWMFVFALFQVATACPFCNPGESDLFTDIAGAQAVVLVSKVDTRKYKVLENWRGEVKVGRIVVAAEPQGKLGKKGTLLLTTAGPPNLPYWSDAPRVLDSMELDFARNALQLSTKPVSAQLDFAAKHLQSNSSEIADAAYNLLAGASLKEVQNRAKIVGQEKLVAWSKNSKIVDEKRSLYLLMCYRGLSTSDIKWVESDLFSNTRSIASPFLGPLTIAYAKLGGADAVAKIESNFYSKSFPATRVTPFNRALTLCYEQNAQEALRSSIRSLFARELEHPQRGPFVLASLALWQDYSVADKVEKLAERNRNVTWIKVAVIRYFRTFNSANATARLGNLKRLDPDLVNRTTDPYKRSELGIDS